MTPDPPNWQLLIDCARDLSARGWTVFTRADLIACVQARHPDRKRATLDPIIQGMTINATGGPVSACGKVFVRIGHGEYRLRGPDDGEEPAPSQPVPSPGRPCRSRAKIERRVREVINDFASYAEAFDRSTPFTRPGQYELHRETIDLRIELGSVSAAIADDNFLRLLHQTLDAWGMTSRAAKLKPLPDFAAVLRRHVVEIAALNHHDIEQLGREGSAVVDSIYSLVDTLAITDNKAKIVAATKTLHHLLPDLVVPMDRAWTGTFFGWQLQYWQYRQPEIFTEAYRAFLSIAAEAHPARLVGAGWRTSRTKLIDNALIGFCIANGLQPSRP